MSEKPGLPDLDAEYESFKRERVKVRCATCQLEPELREWVDRRLSTDEPMRPIADFLGKRGIAISPTALGNHRAHVS